MLGRGVLSRLHCLTQQEGKTLTLYVDLDQGARANRHGGFLVQAEGLMRSLRAEVGDDPGLDHALDRAVRLVSDLEPRGRSAMVVVHPETTLEEIHQAWVRFPSSAYWRRGAFLRPVVEAMDENERYAVVLADARQARLFTVYLGEIAEYGHLLAETGARSRGVGVDQWRAEKRQERHHDQEVTAHAKAIIDALNDLNPQLYRWKLGWLWDRINVFEMDIKLNDILNGDYLSLKNAYEDFNKTYSGDKREVLSRLLKRLKGYMDLIKDGTESQNPESLLFMGQLRILKDGQDELEQIASVCWPEPSYGSTGVRHHIQVGMSRGQGPI